MNFFNKILEIETLFDDLVKKIDDEAIETILMSFITTDFTYEPCIHLDEDEEWVYVVTFDAQAGEDPIIEGKPLLLALKKEDIVGFGICNNDFEMENHSLNTTCDKAYL